MTTLKDKTKPVALFCCDLSLHRPGFALLKYDPVLRKASLLRKSNVDNKTHWDKNKKPRGQMLTEIATELYSYIDPRKREEDLPIILVRERGFYRYANETQALFEVVGVADLYGWRAIGTPYDEISPTRIKSILTGNGKASKEEVASALTRYVGEQEYESDDESDATAVGIAWLIDKGLLDPPPISPKEKEKK